MALKPPRTAPCASWPAATVAKAASKTSQGGVVWPPGQPADIKSGRLVFNTNVHGAVFNTAAGKQTLAAFLDGLRRNTAAVFPPRAFGAMVLNGGSGLRLVNDPAYPCSCQGALQLQLAGGQQLVAELRSNKCGWAGLQLHM